MIELLIFSNKYKFKFAAAVPKTIRCLHNIIVKFKVTGITVGVCYGRKFNQLQLIFLNKIGQTKKL